MVASVHFACRTCRLILIIHQQVIFYLGSTHPYVKNRMTHTKYTKYNHSTMDLGEPICHLLEQWNTHTLSAGHDSPFERGDNFSIEIRTQVTSCFPSFGLFDTACCTRRILSCPFIRGHYITNPNKAPLRGNPSKLPCICIVWFRWNGSHLMIPVHFQGLKRFKPANIDALTMIDHDSLLATWITSGQIIGSKMPAAIPLRLHFFVVVC